MTISSLLFSRKNKFTSLECLIQFYVVEIKENYRPFYLQCTNWKWPLAAAGVEFPVPVLFFTSFKTINNSHYHEEKQYLHFRFFINYRIN